MAKIRVLIVDDSVVIRRMLSDLLASDPDILGITHHHNPEQGLDVICDLTYLANQVAKHIEAGLDGQPCVLSFDPGVAERLGMTVQALENFYPIAATRFAQVSRRYDVV